MGWRKERRRNVGGCPVECKLKMFQCLQLSANFFPARRPSISPRPSLRCIGTLRRLPVLLPRPPSLHHRAVFPTPRHLHRRNASRTSPTPAAHPTLSGNHIQIHTNPSTLNINNDPSIQTLPWGLHYHPQISLARRAQPPRRSRARLHASVRSHALGSRLG